MCQFFFLESYSSATRKCDGGFSVSCFCFQPSDEHINRGIDFMVEAAEAGDRGAMVYMGRAFETGDGLGTLR